MKEIIDGGEMGRVIGGRTAAESDRARKMRRKAESTSAQRRSRLSALAAVRPVRTASGRVSMADRSAGTDIGSRPGVPEWKTRE